MYLKSKNTNFLNVSALRYKTEKNDILQTQFHIFCNTLCIVNLDIQNFGGTNKEYYGIFDIGYLAFTQLQVLLKRVVTIT